MLSSMPGKDVVYLCLVLYPNACLLFLRGKDIDSQWMDASRP